jgi:hypothetical protein
MAPPERDGAGTGSHFTVGQRHPSDDKFSGCGGMYGLRNAESIA